MLPPLTKRQKQILDYINDSIVNYGYAPSLKEIKKYFNLKAISTIHEHLENLKSKGYIKKEMNQARGIQILKTSKDEKFREVSLTFYVKQGKLKSLRSVKTIILDGSTFESGFPCFCVLVEDDSLKGFGVERKDILVVSENPSCSKENMIITQIGKTKKITSYTSKLDPIGKITCILRNLKN